MGYWLEPNATWRTNQTPYNVAMPESTPLVAVIMGSKSDWDTMRNAVEILDELGVPNEARVLSAHRTPEATAEFAQNAADRGLRVIIAGAGGAAHLAGVIAAHTGCRSWACPFSRSSRGWTRFCPQRKCQAGFRSERWRSERPAQKMPLSWRLQFSPPRMRRFAKNCKYFAGNNPRRSWPRNCQLKQNTGRLFRHPDSNWLFTARPPDLECPRSQSRISNPCVLGFSSAGARVVNSTS